MDQLLQTHGRTALSTFAGASKSLLANSCSVWPSRVLVGNKPTLSVQYPLLALSLLGVLTATEPLSKVSRLVLWQSSICCEQPVRLLAMCAGE